MANKVVVIGAGQAGLQVAVSVRQSGYDGEVLLLGGEQHLPYQHPPLSKQVLKGEWPVEKCRLRHADFFDQHGIVLRQGVSAVSLDSKRKRVQTDDSLWIDYEWLVICTGSRLNTLHIPGSDLQGVHYLRTIDHALELLPHLREGTRLVVAGGGYIGLEVATSARSRGCNVVVVEALERVMKRSAVGPVATFFQQRHEREGVSFHLNNRLSAIEGTHRVEAVVLDDGTHLPADLLMIGIGVRPQLRWLEGSGVETGRGVRVDECCRTNVHEVFAAGDVTEFQHPLFDGWLVLESVQNAVSQGKIAAANICGHCECYEEVPWFWSDQYDCRFQMAGIPQAGDELVMRESGPNSISVLSVGRHKLNAVQCVNTPRDYILGRKLIGKAANVDIEQIHDPDTDLKDLL